MSPSSKSDISQTPLQLPRTPQLRNSLLRLLNTDSAGEYMGSAHTRRSCGREKFLIHEIQQFDPDVGRKCHVVRAIRPVHPHYRPGFQLKRQNTEVVVLQTTYGESSDVMLKVEFESAKEIYKLMPGLIPKPYGYGRYQTMDPVTYFYLSEFADMDTTTAPEPVEFASNLAELHKKSQSPTGKFGFHIVTCDSKMPHTVDWEESWAIFFGKLLRGVCKFDLETNGPWPEIERATEQLITKVVPRLFGNTNTKASQLNHVFCTATFGNRI